jgi:hypothetical protein
LHQHPAVVAFPELGQDDQVGTTACFFFSADYDLEHAVPGSLRICPADKMKSALERDYRAMTGMIFGEVPSFESVRAALSKLEERLNG